MRFRFRGFERETGRPVDGHVEASDKEAAYQALSDHGIITESLSEDSKRPRASADAPVVSQFAEALEDALDLSSSQVPFDALTQRYRGKKVWVIDREKIRHRVAEVVDATLAASEADRESGASARQRVADAIGGLFHDTRNIASPQDAETIAQMRALIAAAGLNNAGQMTGAGLAEQIGRLTGVVEQAEGLIAAMQAALRNVESGGAPRRRLVATPSSVGGEQNEVLREIFQSNLALRRSLAPAAKPGKTAVGSDPRSNE